MGLIQHFLRQSQGGLLLAQLPKLVGQFKAHFKGVFAGVDDRAVHRRGLGSEVVGQVNRRCWVAGHRRGWFGRWRGFGGKTNFNGPGFESYAWAAGIGASVDRSAVFATSHVPTVHPIMAAKQATVIDHITNGRFALNIVTGWHRQEIEMFGIPLREHDDRYDMAAEWLEIIKKLWTEEEEFDYQGKYYNIQKGYLMPKPVQRPFPAVMNAGGSEKGRHFCAKYCDIAFVGLVSHALEDAKAQIAAYRKLAREQYGREIQVWTNTYVVQGETEKDAKDLLREYIDEKGDWEAAENLVETMGLNALTFPPEVMQDLKRH